MHARARALPKLLSSVLFDSCLVFDVGIERMPHLREIVNVDVKLTACAR